MIVKRAGEGAGGRKKRKYTGKGDEWMEKDDKGR